MTQQTKGQDHLEACSLTGLAVDARCVLGLPQELWSKGTSTSLLPTKVCTVKHVVFIVVIYGCESWTVKKAECRRNEAFKLC